jgi:3',5'-cyclic AMP phosphodiesterase CpdA
MMAAMMGQLGADSVRIVHLSDIHFWQYAFNPLRLMSKRLAGMASLLAGRARRFRLAGVPRLVERVRQVGPDHILITGDLTTTALPDEFRAARLALANWLEDPVRVTVIPGNHDRYTWWAHRSRRFERFFGEFAPRHQYPWLRQIDPTTAILGLDPTQAAVTARGWLAPTQLAEARNLVAAAGSRAARLIVACHYPVAVPEQYERELATKRMLNAQDLRHWLARIGPHLYCCGHVHATWAHRPADLPAELCLNPGAPLLRSRTGRNSPGFLEILLDGPGVVVQHHTWTGEAWEVQPLHRESGFFAAQPSAAMPDPIKPGGG